MKLLLSSRSFNLNSLLKFERLEYDAKFTREYHEQLRQLQENYEIKEAKKELERKLEQGETISKDQQPKGIVEKIKFNYLKLRGKSKKFNKNNHSKSKPEEEEKEEEKPPSLPEMDEK